jgi:acyl carrier protein
VTAPRRERLIRFLQRKLEELEREPAGALRDDTSLLASGLLDSMSILELAEWIDGEMRAPLDLASVDVKTRWDTIAGILDFVEQHAAERDETSGG